MFDELRKQIEMNKVKKEVKKGGYDDRYIKDIEYSKILSSNVVCANITDIIFEKTMELVNKDNTMNVFTKSLIISTVKKIKEPTKEYLLKMSRNEANDILDKIRKELNKVG